VITSNKKPVAVLVSLQGAERESLPLGLNPAFMKIIRRARAEVKRGEVYSLQQVKQEMLVETNRSNKPLQRTRRKAARR
jgi:PHD/YefM family antitoxin component YafN of YafNO toxin-antitoxin module